MKRTFEITSRATGKHIRFEAEYTCKADRKEDTTMTIYIPNFEEELEYIEPERFYAEPWGLEGTVKDEDGEFYDLVYNSEENYYAITNV